METNKVEIANLKEREKELNCLYKVEELLNKPYINLEEIFIKLIDIIPIGWRYPEICKVKITYYENIYKSLNLIETEYYQTNKLFLRSEVVGSITVYYSELPPDTKDGIFLKEEYKLLNTIADRLSQVIYHNKCRNILNEIGVCEDEPGRKKLEWEIILELLKKTDRNLFSLITRKMLTTLYTMKIKEAEELIKVFGIGPNLIYYDFLNDNRPLAKHPVADINDISIATFRLASIHLNEKNISSNIYKWIRSANSYHLVKILEKKNSSLQEIVDALIHYKSLMPDNIELSESTEKSLRVALLNRFFFDRFESIKIAKKYIAVDDYFELINKIIYPSESYGKLGGKSAGLFLASHIIRDYNKTQGDKSILKDIKTPKTWYITSDGINSFLDYNNLEDILDQKYKDMEQIRVEYPQIIKLLKNSNFPSEIINGLSRALDDFGDIPLIVRSSSLLEDSFGSAFSGKYKSLFLANKGSKHERLTALMDAIAEIYASVFAPDPIEYRIEHGLLDLHEEMGIMIQEVVGTKVGKYYFPHFGGVAFCFNEFRWSPRIKREDGLIRIVPGLGTRAVDRLTDDYPILLSPGKPNLRVNSTFEEMIRYSPQNMDVINLETNRFETIKISDFLKMYGEQFVGVHKIVSVVKDNHIADVSSFDIDFQKDEFIVTFNNFLKNSNFLDQINLILKLLQERLETPVDIEFAFDGRNLYLLQCRPQAHKGSDISYTIPNNIPLQDIVFTAKKYVSNGYVSNITHIVYVDPIKYGELASLQDLIDVGVAVGKLNKILPKKKFILMGPGRWGSRGDIKLGVKVTYSDFNNTTMLIEIAKKKGNYLPDLSFGTHFFLDLVESSIRYLPLYPDDNGIIFNEEFLSVKNSILPEILPEFKHLADTIRVIDVVKTSEGKVLQVIMNADEEKAIGYLS